MTDNELRLIAAEDEEFTCCICWGTKNIGSKGKATRNGKEIDVCLTCCHEEQMKQFYAEM